MHTAQTIYIK